MTLDELEQSIAYDVGNHTHVYSRYDGMEGQASLLLEAIAQIKRAVFNVQCGIAEPSEHRAETYLLMLLTQAHISHKGFTPREIKQ